MSPMDAHTLAVLEFDKVRDVLAAFAQTDLGRAAARALAPLGSAACAAAALRETEEMAALLHGGARLALGSLRDGCADIERARGFHRPLEPDELAGIAALVRAAERVKELCGERAAAACPHLHRRTAAAPLPADLPGRIEDAVDARGHVRDSASPRLAQLRERARVLRETLRDKVAAMLRRPSVARVLQEEQPSMRNDRYVLAVRSECRGQLPGVIHGYSQSGATVYVEPQEIVVEGNELGDAAESVRREETRILLELTRVIVNRAPEIRAARDLVAWADLTYAKRELVRVYEFCVPAMAPDHVLAVSRARHPLLVFFHVAGDLRAPDLPAIRGKVMPFDLELGKEVLMLIVTGPNTGGKTVMLKAVGLLAVMAACGLPIPAAPPARIPYYARVFVDAGDEQSLQQSLSTFSAHMQHIVRVVNEAERGDLAILDELGAGTDPLEGGALGAVVLDHLRGRGVHTLASTHLGLLKQYAYTHREAANAAMEFDPAALAPTYRVLLGAPGQSCALLVAERLGLRPELIAAAREAIKNPEPQEVVMRRMEEARRAVEVERRGAQKVRRRLAVMKGALAEKLRDADDARTQAGREADDEVERRVRALRDEALAIIPKLKSVPPRFLPHVAALEKAVETMLARTPLGERRDAIARALKVNSEVYVPVLGEKCRVVRISKSKRRLTVRAGALEAEVGFDDISWMTPQGETLAGE
ncbi:MAG TPA: hypothetical protein DCM87_07380 [Planctomycetes bacterium]|nr:hypothetical protein [Planctomycetota bacterium]